MTDEVQTAPTGGSETAPASEAATTQDQGNAGRQDAPKPTLRESLAKAAAQVEARAAQPSERDQANAVLREGVGADDKLVSDAERAAAKSESGRRGWETRRANQDQAQERQQQEQRDDRLAGKIADAVKPAATDRPQQAQGAQESQYKEAPGRFAAPGKEFWKDTPEPVRAEVVRAIAEMESGIAKHKEGSDRWAELAEFEGMAKQHNTTVKAALTNYVRLEKLFADDPVKGVEQILAGKGISLSDFAAYVIDRDLGVADPANDPTIRELRQTVTQLQSELNGYKTNQQQSARASINAEVAEFSKTHPRLADPQFESEMAFLVQSGRAKTLQEAYDLAERLIPAPQAPSVANPDPAEQTRKAKLSPTGAPGQGSNPAGSMRRSGSIRESLERAARQVG